MILRLLEIRPRLRPCQWLELGLWGIFIPMPDCHQCNPEPGDLEIGVAVALSYYMFGYKLED